MYLRILRTFLILVLISIIMTSALLMGVSQNVVNRLTYRASLESLAQNQVRIQNALDKANSITNIIFSDIDVAYMLYDNKFQPSRLRKAVIKLNTYRNMEDSIHSIYIYNGITQTVSVSSRYHGSVENAVFGENANFVDAQLADMVEHLQDYDRKLPLERYIDELHNGEVQTYPGYTFFFSQNAKGGPFSSNVFVNFDASLFQMEMSQGVTALLNDRGQVLVSDVYDLYYDFSSEEMWRQLSERKEKSGSVRVDVSGEEMLVTYLTVDQQNGWRLVKMMPYALVSDEAAKLSKLACLITALVVLLGVSAVIFSSRRVYVPILQMNYELYRANQENEHLRNVESQQLLRNLLQGIPVNYDRLQELKLIPLSGKMRLIMICVRDVAGLRERYGNQLHDALIQVGRVTQRCFSQDSSAFYMELAEGEFVLLMPENETFERKTTENAARKTLEIVKNSQDIRLRILISSVFNEMGQIAVVYSHLKDSMFRMSFMPETETIFAEDVAEAANENFDYQIALENQLHGLLMSEKWEMACDMIHRILGQVFGYSYYIVDMTVVRLAFLCISVLRTIHTRYDPLHSFVIPEPLELNMVDSVSDVYDYFDGLVKRIASLSENKKSSRNRALAARVDEVLQRRISDSTLNLDSIADEIGMSAAYVGRVYKTTTGKGISEKMNELRMEGAKELLRMQKQLTITQISEMIGFSSNTYFTRAFKREVGETPNEYRIHQTQEK